ncbi:MAG: universal stress protein [Pseudomonadota bacterium]
MRSILVTVDETPSSMAARRLAVALARRSGAAVHGVTGFEMGDLEKPEMAPLGGTEVAYARLQQRERQARERRVQVSALPAKFESSLAAEGLKAPCALMERDVRRELLRRAEASDLVVSGRDAEFHLQASEDGVTPLVEHLIADGSRPVIVTGPELHESGPVMVAYDGSTPAAKALQMATLLGVLADAEVHVVSMAHEIAEAQAVAGRAQAFLGAHGVAPRLDAHFSTDDAAGFLTERAREIGARLLVMGAFGHRGWRELLFGSCTRRLLDSVPLPLFIYH